MFVRCLLCLLRRLRCLRCQLQSTLLASPLLCVCICGCLLPAAAAAGDPESFSRLDLSLPDSELRRRFPLFPVRGSAAAAICSCAL
jgi:hypothetical protein